MSRGGMAYGGLPDPYEFLGHFTQRSRSVAIAGEGLVFSRDVVDRREEGWSDSTHSDALEAVKDDE